MSVDEGGPDPEQRPRLRRSVGPVMLVLYGVGTMVGGGFYALSGKVAGEVGVHAPLAFAVAGLLALLSALSFAELASRMPHAGGSARYVEGAFGSRSLAAVTGWLIIATGVVSAATLAVATVGFLRDFIAVPEPAAIAALVLTMGAIAAWGVGQAVGLVAAITVIEVGALIYAVIFGLTRIDDFGAGLTASLVTIDPSVWRGVVAAAFLAFYAFIGFEDMVTLAEEVREPQSTMPRAVIAALVLTTLLYVFASAVLVLAVDAARLAEAHTPLAELVRAQGPRAMAAIGIVSILTGINGALVQIVMAARVAFGMADRGYAPRGLARLGRRTRTPLVGTALATGTVLVLALAFELTTLARATSAVILVVFALVNAGLWWIKRREPRPPARVRTLPRWIPILGMLASLSVLLLQLVEAMQR